MAFADDRCIRPLTTLRSVPALRAHPLDTLIRISIAENYAHERATDSELHINMPGLWCDHELSICWDEKEEQLSFLILFDGRVPGGRSDSICRLLSLLNENIASGHFGFWQRESSLVYRNSISLKGGAKLSTEQALDLMSRALDAAERGYPAAQYVIWAGKSPEDALAEALVDIATHG